MAGVMLSVAILGRNIDEAAPRFSPSFVSANNTPRMSTEAAERKRVDVVIPCYNEVGVLRASVEKTLAFLDGHPGYAWRVVIADNGSNDGTGALATQLE